MPKRPQGDKPGTEFGRSPMPSATAAARLNPDTEASPAAPRIDSMPTRSMLGVMNCPECNTALSERPASFEGKLYECPIHGPFGVTGAAETSGFWDLPSNIRIGAMRHARANAVRRNYPLISTYHF